MGYYLDDDGEPIEHDDVPEDDYADHLPDFWTGPPAASAVEQDDSEPEVEKCPRCLGPLAECRADVGATSRVVSWMRICGRCGADEAVRDATGLPPVPPDDWPLRNLLTF
ncbi:hypothetical protein AB0C52_35835 [Streptomyces sp. NPDC048717]|uniref:hypothetical protein n=1 Tax=Streptomyces sp. NPDC048717 TaxID=3154928 RepID=UPI003427F3B1